MLSRLVIAFLPRSKHLLISWLQSPSAVILEPQRIKSVIVSTVCPSICHEVVGPDAMILVFWMLSLKPTFSLSSFTVIKRLFSSSSLSAIRVVLSKQLQVGFIINIFFFFFMHVFACMYVSRERGDVCVCVHVGVCSIFSGNHTTDLVIYYRGSIYFRKAKFV